MYALSQIKAPIGGNSNNGVAGAINYNVTNFMYEDAILHRTANGLLGFKKVISINDLSNIQTVTENELNTDFAFLYNTRSTKTLLATNQLLNETLVTNNFITLDNTIKKYIVTTKKTTNLNHFQGKFVTEDFTYDNYANPTIKVKKIGYFNNNVFTDVETETTTTNYNTFNTTVPAKPTKTILQKIRANAPLATSTTDYYYNSLGFLTSMINFSGSPKAVTTTYTYNNFGNGISTNTSANNLNSRIVNKTYDTKGRYILNTTKVGTGLLQSETATFLSKWGLPLTSTSSDCLTTSYEYDNWGKLKKTTLPNGNIAFVSYIWHNSSTTNPSNYDNAYKLYFVQTTNTSGTPTKTYYDRFGKEWKQEIASMYGINAAWHTTLTTYNNKGNVKTTTNTFFPQLPYLIADGDYIQPIETPRLTTYNYDVYDRQSSIVNDIGTVTYNYNQMGNGSLKTDIINIAGQTTSQIVDATDKVIASIDDGGQLNFKYNSRGNQTTVTQDGIDIANGIFDQYGMQTALNDVNAGTTTFEYDAFSQITKQTDEKGNIFTIEYDDFGRITQRESIQGKTNFEYYKDLNSNCSNNQLSREISNIGNGMVKEYYYDALKQLSSKAISIDGATYTTSYAYNNYSKLIQTTYPSGVSIYNSYDIMGYLLNTNLGTNATDKLFFDGQVNGEGKYLQYTLGNNMVTSLTYDKDFPQSSITNKVQKFSYVFDQSIGNLLQRTDIKNNQTETFSFDNLNRLRNNVRNNSQEHKVTYDSTVGKSMGNIVSKTDVGYYKYKTDKINAVAYTTTQPMAGQVAVLPTPINAIPAIEQLITYNNFNKATTITEGNYQLVFTYGTDQERIKTELFSSTNGFDPTTSPTLEETRYFFENYEILQKNGKYYEIHYVDGGSGTSALIIKVDGKVTPYFVYTDYLGSITTVTDKAATIVAKQSYDAWGRQRQTNDWNTFIVPSTMPNVPDWLYRGYTGHENLPHFNLINMNGRIYDPILGRMLSPDNFVSSTYNTQAYNRYAYANNNPLTYTDPSGNFVWFAPLIYSAISVGIDMLLNDGKMDFGQIVKSGLSGAIGGALSGTPSVGLALSGAFFSKTTSLMNIPIYQSNNFNLSVTPSFALGTSGYTIGGNINMSGHSGDFVYATSFGAGINSGVTSLGKTAMGPSSYWNASGFIGTVKSNGEVVGGGYSFNSFGGKTGQGVGAINLQFGKLSIRLDEDAIGDGKDRSRTGGLLLTYRINDNTSLALGGSMMTGEAFGKNIKGGNPNATSQGKPTVLGMHDKEINPDLRGGTMYGGIIYNGQAYFGGNSAENRLHQIQNSIHRLKIGNWIPFGTPYFKDWGMSSKMYSYNGTYHANYLFY